MNPDILQSLEKGVCVVTATRRLAYEVQAAFNTYQLAQGKTVWPGPKIETWDSWMQSTWQSHNVHTSQLCLNSAQVQQLFAEIIEADVKQQSVEQSHELAALWNYTATAKTALDAWQLCHQWHISFTALRTTEHLDHAGFGRWATNLYARLSENNWVSSVQIADKLIDENTVLLRPTILFGFDHLNAQQLKFIEHCNATQSKISHINSKKTPAGTIKRYVFENTREEWQQIGAWARNKLSEKPDLKLGIITPNTQNIRSIASQCLREQLTPHYFEHPIPAPFHFSQGQPLTSTTIIKSALACLDLLLTIDFKQLAPLFISPHWGSDSERSARLKLLNALSKNISYQFDLFQLIQAISRIEQTQQNQRPSVVAKLNALQKLKATNRDQHSIAHWRAFFRHCLDALDWPGSNIDSTQFQAHQAWENCLNDWLKLDTFCQPMRMNKALSSLKQHCQQTQYQPQAQRDAPIQIMGVLEAAELTFDAVWLAGFDEQAWPVRESANPFIPIHRQIEAGIPAASTEVHSAHAIHKTEQLCALCDDVQMSHAHIQEDISLAVSPLLVAFAHTDSTALPKPFSLTDAIRAVTPALIYEQDNNGHTLESDYSGGGTGLIKAQSACPFQAYAQYRLLARAQITPEMGMDNMKRGGLLHEIMASLWNELQASRALHDHIQQGSLEDLIARHTQSLVSSFARLSGLGEGFIASQSKRLNTLIADWLALEAQRPAFAVQNCEQKIEHTIDGLKLNFALDRIDQVLAHEDQAMSSVSRLIIDYKSGNCSLKDWVGERPDEPQIPLYYLAIDQQTSSTPVEALTFAQVKQGDVKFVGVSHDEGVLPEVKQLDKLAWNTSLKKDMREWSELKPKWGARLKTLVNEFQQGVAHVDPKSSASCTYCDLGAVCRISSAIAQEDGDVAD